MKLSATKWCAFTCVLSMTFQGCALGRVQLHAPPADAPIETRIRSAEKLELQSQEFEQTSTGGNAGMKRIYLADGAEINDPRDLIPVVPPDSETHKSIRKFTHHNKRTKGFTLGGFGGFLAGLGLLVPGLVMVDDVDQKKAGLAMSITGGIIIVGGIVATAIGVANGVKANRARSQAFNAYDEDLLRRLDLERVPNAVRIVPVEQLEPKPDVVYGPGYTPPRLACEVCSPALTVKPAP